MKNIFLCDWPINWSINLHSSTSTPWPFLHHCCHLQAPGLMSRAFLSAGHQHPNSALLLTASKQVFSTWDVNRRTESSWFLCVLLSRKTLHKENRGGAHSRNKYHKLWTVVGQFQERLVKQKKPLNLRGILPVCWLRCIPNQTVYSSQGPCSSLPMLPSNESLIIEAKKV